jgi:hypothetical protein
VNNLIDLWIIEVVNKDGFELPDKTKITPGQYYVYGEMRHVDKDGKMVIPKTIFWNEMALQHMNQVDGGAFNLENKALGKGALIGALVQREKDGKIWISSRLIGTFPENLSDLKEGDSTFADKCVEIST